ncbi:hypothetical protein GOV13_01545 [Candidatus Pacearchaeota archaeon]|nr:hypothetical protein [Candidatus Pacearchaeota archaeon]
MTFKGLHTSYVVGGLYVESRGNASDAVKIFNKLYSTRTPRITISATTILRWWREGDLKIRPPNKGYTHGISENEFRKIHNLCDKGNVEKIIESTGLKRKKVNNKCRRYGLDYF